MRWFGLILFCVVFSAVCCEPEPKKYKSEVKEKNKDQKPSLTETERKFLREVEAKFGIQNDEVEIKNIDDNNKAKLNGTIQLPFPAVIAIEIVNDTDTKTKGKRTIDANLGYGYRTNNGYSYTYFGKPAQEKGRFTIYPYSQEDIPPAKSHTYSSGKYSGSSTSVEIQPSQAYELVEEQNDHGYDYKKPSDNVKGLVSPPLAYSSPPSTLYTTYNGQQLSGLSGQFPMVMSNYFVEPNQLLKNPHYQSVGLTHDHLRPHGSHLEQKVVPVLVLRVPSSYIKNPSAELYANLPQNYPLSQHLNNINLQELVNQYFKKIGYSFAPQIMTYPTLPLATPEAAVSPQAPHYESQHYSNPYVKPTYTQSAHSGVQYSAVKPVMAKYPSYPSQQYLSHLVQQNYQQPQQQYEYQYVSRPDTRAQPYYTQQYYQHHSQTPQIHQVVEQEVPQHTSSEQYAAPQYSSSEAPAGAYEAPQYVSQSQVQYEAKPEAHEYEQPKEEYVSQEYGPSKLSEPVHSSQESQSEYGPPKAADNQQYYYPSHEVSKETVAIFSNGQAVQHSEVNADTGSSQSYVYQKQVNDESASDSLILTENYPSKDHTIATVLPTKYQLPRKQAHSSIQSVSYVTPVPHKYQSPYNIMVPQTVFKNPSTENIQYVNSHSLPSYSNQEYNPEHEYTVSPQYVPPVGKQKPPSYPRNYHSHPKRMTKPNNKPETKSNPERNQKKKSS